MTARSLFSLALLFTLAALGAGTGILLIPTYAPSLHASLFSEQPIGFWFLSRASGIIAYLLLAISTLLGLLLSSKTAKVAHFAPQAIALHDFSALLALIWVGFHALILLGDQHLNANLSQILLPFTLPHQLQTWFGMGQIAAYLFTLILLTYQLKKHIGITAWRWLHPMAFLAYMLATLHALLAGSDTTTPLLMGLYALLNSSILLLSLYRLLSLKK